MSDALLSDDDVCRELSLEPHVLRFWEIEFPRLRPRRSRSGGRSWRVEDVQMLRRLRTLLIEEQQTLPAARRRLEEELAVRPPASDLRQLGFEFVASTTPAGSTTHRDGLMTELRNILRILESPEKRGTR